MIIQYTNKVAVHKRTYNTTVPRQIEWVVRSACARQLQCATTNKVCEITMRKYLPHEPRIAASSIVFRENGADDMHDVLLYHVYMIIACASVYLSYTI